VPNSALLHINKIITHNTNQYLTASLQALDTHNKGSYKLNVSQAYFEQVSPPIFYPLSNLVEMGVKCTSGLAFSERHKREALPIFHPRQ
jgi:hypothetical protein